MDTKIDIGSTVVVGPAYKMNGTYEVDAWTGKTMRVVGAEGRDTLLAPNLPHVDAEDGVVWITVGRLTPTIAEGTIVNWRGSLGRVKQVSGRWALVRWAGVGQGEDEVLVSELTIDPT